MLNSWVNCVNELRFLYRFIVGHLGCIQLVGITNKAAMNIVEHMPLWHGGRLLGIYSRVVLLVHQLDFFSIFQNNPQNDFQNGSNSLQSHQQWRSVLLLHILNYIGCHLRFLNVVNLIGIKWNPAVVLISISLITKAFDHSYIFKTVIHL